MKNEEDIIEYLDERRTGKLREIIYANFGRWNKQGKIEIIGSRVQHLCYLLGKEDTADLLFHMTAKEERIIHALASPNSYAVYKMLLIKKEK